MQQCPASTRIKHVVSVTRRLLCPGRMKTLKQIANSYSTTRTGNYWREKESGLGGAGMFFGYLLHGNFNAPVDDQLEEGIRVLDVGCGAGIWSVDMARDFPNSTFVGTDIVSKFTTSHPPNCRFVVANTLEGLPFEDNYFHYVFQRKMAVAFSIEDWAKAIRELIRVTKPGGYIELGKDHLSKGEMLLTRSHLRNDLCIYVTAAVEYSQVFQERGPTWAMFQDRLNKIIQARGGYSVDVSNLPALLHELEDVESDYASAPIGWHDRAGDFIRRAAELLIQNVRTMMRQELDFTDQQYDSMAEDVHDEWVQYRTWKALYYAYGRKRDKYTS
ncbi:S-adenosyl-L-methionine-dependent methyltransferase [Endogone sp. FLAS-F59071]|nr:S-adenosyl-L-methionine-dependent methyltransferase [Endogone sp. FLAS-F59071]|eukprot:RUS19808.1 S-adenosyl-L-methionine-dependent methyltransferase [Endogone sp. FLAS-F59071]